MPSESRMDANIAGVKRGHKRTDSTWSTASAVRKRTTSYNEKKEYHTRIQLLGAFTLNYTFP